MADVPKTTHRKRPAQAAGRPKAEGRGFFIAASASEFPVGGEDALILCPWLRDLDRCDGLFLSALPIHDCNAFIDQLSVFDIPSKARERCYLGVFAIDRLRQTDKLLALLRDKGVSGLINLPTVSFFDGATARAFAALGFTLEAEMSFLDLAKRNGFKAALCAPFSAPAVPTEAFEFVLRHQGPEKLLTFEPNAGR